MRMVESREKVLADNNTAAAAGFQDAEAYEKIMGRWSQRLAPLLLRFGGLADGDRVLDVGCGTGSLTFAMATVANVAAVTGIDLTPGFVAFATSRNSDSRIRFQQGDARALPFEDNAFDRAFSMLVLQFIPDGRRAVVEMQRVVRPGGTVTAAVWDDFSGMPHIRMIWDIAATLDPTIKRPFFRPLSKPNEMASVWAELGLVGVEQTSLLIRMEFESFDDYWLPFTKGEGPPGRLLLSLSESAKSRLTEHVREGYLSGQPDGPRSFASTAWACRGTVPG